MNEDPNEHLTSFLTIVTTCRPQGVSSDQVKRMLFPFSLRGQALSWYNAQGGPTCRSFEELRRKIVAKYYPPSKVDEMRKDLHRFHQFDGEAFCECWERL